MTTMKKPTRSKRNPRRSTRSPKVRRPEGFLSSPAGIAAAIAVAVIVIVAASGLPRALHESPGPEIAVAEPQATVAPPAAKPATAPVSAMKKIVPPAASPTNGVVKADASAPVNATSETPSLPAKELAASTPALVATSTVKPETEKSQPTTVTGCLEAEGPGFRLTDTSGADTLKSRSWKSGFMKKRSSAIDLIDAANTLKLSAHVGQRVSATGTLVDREMRAQSLQSVSPSCR